MRGAKTLAIGAAAVAAIALGRMSLVPSVRGNTLPVASRPALQSVVPTVRVEYRAFMRTGDIEGFAAVRSKLAQAGWVAEDFSAEAAQFWIRGTVVAGDEARVSALLQLVAATPEIYLLTRESKTEYDTLLASQPIPLIAPLAAQSTLPGIRPVTTDVQLDAMHAVGQMREEFGLSGKGMSVHIWDGGCVYDRHVAFGGRVAPRNCGNYRNHATHVAGIIASGDPLLAGTISPLPDKEKTVVRGALTVSRGAAPAASIISFDSKNDLAEMYLETPARGTPRTQNCGTPISPQQIAIAGSKISNHSYGANAGWALDGNNRVWWGDQNADEDEYFGKYVGVAESLDCFIYRNPNWIAVMSAGNERGETDNPCPAASCAIPHLTWDSVATSARRKNDAWDNGGYDTVKGQNLAKNAITVGAIDKLEVFNPTSPDKWLAQARVSSFSSWGPTDDGRIKPDVVANGSFVYGPIVMDTAIEDDDQQNTDPANFSPTLFANFDGTSMATPAVTGVALLLVELHKQRGNGALMADELKAILIHTAVRIPPAGAGVDFKGPSYKTGWGAVQAHSAALVVSAHGAKVATKGVVMRRFARPTPPMVLRGNGGGNIRATLVWIDPPGSVNTRGLDDTTPALKNNLNLRLISPDGREHCPWKLDVGHPDALAVQRCPNDVDNVEVVDVEGGKEGDWQIEITGPSDQDFVLITSGITSRR